MNREQRRQAWSDETLHPNGPLTRSALVELTGADSGLVDEWIDLEGDNESPMSYFDFLQGNAGMMMESFDGEFNDPEFYVSRFRSLMTVWMEINKADDRLRSQDGESKVQFEARTAYLRKQEEERLAHLKAVSMLVQKPPSIVSIPGKLYARYDMDDNVVVSFGFMPAGSDAGYFGPTAIFEDGHGWNGPERFWEATQRYLQNVDEISGEPAMAVVWEEDGWQI